ncbi:Subtilisin-like protease SBT5.4 [Linum grandiflorum]
MTSNISFLLLFVLLLQPFWPISTVSAGANKKSYVVYLGRHSQQKSGRNPVFSADQMSHSYLQLLGSCLLSKEKAKEAIFYSYSSHINGFAAMLEDEEVAMLSSHPGVVSILPNKEHHLHTTRTWAFMGLEDSTGTVSDDSIWKHANFGQDVIIANLDTGVWPESPSFNCTVSEAIPSRWKGQCDTNNGFKCNSKLIGARYFNKGFSAGKGYKLSASEDTARDSDGHGSHTLSTAAGCLVPGANLLGSANGTAKGGSPKAWVATYKVCWPGCYEADILAAFDAAIQDGVDVLSLSLGSYLPQEYSSDSIAIGSFHAARNGISVVCSAGNSGPLASSVTNVSPWILTVAASTVDRQFQSNVTLGNGLQFKGLSYNSNTLPAGKFYPLINAVDAKSSDANVNDAKYCYSGSLDPKMVKGKIVVCIRSSSDVEKSQVVSEAGGVGVVLVNSFSGSPSPQAHFLPASVVSKDDGDSISSYISGTPSPEAYISGSTVIGAAVAPSMASFSSSGPNRLTPEILKPDVTAPGVYILAAYSEATGPTGDSDSRHLPFNIISGTSMSCPHVTGIVGLVKSIHPGWSPAAIKSAIMTTAVTKSNKGESIKTTSGVEANPFNYGAGHVWPNKAMDPGLVYDMNLTDHLNFLCYIGYDDKQLAMFYDKPYQCPSKTTDSLSNINYPSITIPELSGIVTVTRTLKNVGTPGVYMANVDVPPGVSVKVEPESLEFKAVDEEKSFRITFEPMADIGSGYGFGELNWSDGIHNVKSPIVVKKAGKALLQTA